MRSLLDIFRDAVEKELEEAIEAAILRHIDLDEIAEEIVDDMDFVDMARVALME